ncbi:MAG: thioesterase [Methylacidiphilales bacterium]|nr:thioesterase [Candidatus Methylacidiphilales bacterium]NJR16418.1 thioesterase [Calothrix sp. CSU_2_0]
MSTKQSISSWLTCFQPNSNAKLRLFCFPYAGGGTLAFREWCNDLSPDIEVYAIQLPGRENRLREAAFYHLQPLVEELVAAILPSLNKNIVNPPFAFFGYSMGGLIAFEVTRYLRRIKDLNPVHLFVAAASAPHLTASKPPIHNLPQTEFIKELGRFNGTPTTVLENLELMELLSPTLRADFSVLETYVYKEEIPLSCPITTFGGLEDTEVSQVELSAWKEHTNGRFSLQMLPGDHFFLHTEREYLLNLIIRELGILLE